MWDILDSDLEDHITDTDVDGTKGLVLLFQLQIKDRGSWLTKPLSCLAIRNRGGYYRWGVGKKVGVGARGG